MDVIVSDFNKKISDTLSTVQKIQAGMSQKVNSEEFNSQLSQKLSLNEFERWFPTKEFEDPQQFFKTLISGEVSTLEK